MAKRKTVAPAAMDAPVPRRNDLALKIASALFAGMLVYVTYYPSDSVSIERGDGLWFSAIAIIAATILWAVSSPTKIEPFHAEPSSAEPSNIRDLSHRRWSLSIDVIAMSLAAWMMIAALCMGSTGNLRQATNEAWFWIAMASVLTASRRLFVSSSVKRAALVLLVGCSVGLGVHAIHQNFVSLPRTLSEYLADPDGVLRMAGIDAPPGSPTRMVFENRLLDGGPTGTFALANSLAGVLLMGYLVSGGLIVMTVWHYRELRKPVALVLVIGLAVVGVIFSALFFTHSRSGIVAALVGIGIFGMLTLSRRWFAVAVSGFVMLVASVMMIFAVFGKEEWLSQAPSSLAFRFQYWRATWKLAIDRPLFGAGPGNFQAVYPAYREASAAETIAEPHNFFFETLASGGFVALAILLAMFFAVLTFRWRLSRETADESETITDAVDRRPHGWWLGAVSSLVLIWLLGLATGQAPDWDAHILAVPAALVAMTVAWRALSNTDFFTFKVEQRIDAIVVTAMVSLLLHLVVSGGWTVPGVAVWFWVLVGMWVPVPQTSEGRTSERMAKGAQPSIKPHGVAIVAGLALLVMLRWMSLGPVEASASAIRAALAAQSQSQTDRAIRDLERAVAADPWSPEPHLLLSDFYRWQLIQNRENNLVAQKWREAAELAIQRSGGDPSLIGLIAAQPLHLFQRWGLKEDLERAMQLFSLACEKSPTNAAFFAQRAEIAERLGNSETSILDAKQAFGLSQLGENLERRLWVEKILVVDHAGTAAGKGPILQTANVLLENQLDTSDVMGETH